MPEVLPANVHATLGKWVLADGLEIVCDLTRSQGSYLYDAKSGKELLDFFGFFASRPLAFNHPKLADPKFLEKIGRIALHKTSNCDAYTVEYAEFADKFGSIACGNNFAHLFFIEGGAPAVENALKTAFDWKHRKNLAAGRGDRGSQILHFKQAFHGRTGYALSITDSHDPRKTQHFPKYEWPRVTNPVMTHPFDDAAKKRVADLEQVALGEITRAFDQNRDDVAAIIIEPVQGEGGDNYFRSEFLRELRKVADQREALLIFDEIQTGFGSAGAWWDWQNHDVKPDIIVFGKKTQVCGFAATSRVDEVEGVFKVPSRISSTFEGNIVDMVRASKIIDIIVADGLINNAKSMGNYLLKLLTDLAANHPQMTSVRGRGLLAAFDLPTAEERSAFLKACFEEELLVLAGGSRSIRLRPGLDVGADAIGRAAAQLEAALRRAYKR